MGTIDNLLAGSIDMHVHHGPDFLLERRLDALEAAMQARDIGMRGLVLKNHGYPTAPLASMISRLVPEVSVFGSVCLDVEMGGLSVHIVETSAKLGAKVVWMPTFSAANSKARVERALGIKRGEEELFILDAAGGLVTEVKEILRVIRDYDMVLASGHLSPREVFALVDEARAEGISKIVITHPLSQGLTEESLKLEELRQLGQGGAFIEHCLWELMPTGGRGDPKEMAQAMREIGPEHCIMCTDFGQVHHPPPAEGMRMFIATMLKNGLEEREIEFMVKSNPAKLLGLG